MTPSTNGYAQTSQMIEVILDDFGFFKNSYHEPKPAFVDNTFTTTAIKSKIYPAKKKFKTTI